nr:MAG: ORF3 [Torque teno polar bear virus 19]
MRELLEALSEERDVWWRSSPQLFASETDSEDSEKESGGPTKKGRARTSFSLVSETPTHETHSGVWSLSSSINCLWFCGRQFKLPHKYSVGPKGVPMGGDWAEPINYISKCTSEWLSFYVRARSGTERPKVSEGSDERGRVPEA